MLSIKNYLKPDLQIQSINDLDVEFLKSQHINSLIFDVDNTLAKYHGTSVDNLIEQKFNELTQVFPCCILSNTNKKRRSLLEDYFGITVVQSDIRKPDVESFYEALDILSTTSSETAMIGDRILTDIVGANKAGIYSIKVEPIDETSEPRAHNMMRKLESFVLKLYSK